MRLCVSSTLHLARAIVSVALLLSARAQGQVRTNKNRISKLCHKSLDTWSSEWIQFFSQFEFCQKYLYGPFGGYIQFIIKMIIVGINVSEASIPAKTQIKRFPFHCLLCLWKICLYFPCLCCMWQNDILLITTIWNDYCWTAERDFFFAIHSIPCTVKIVVQQSSIIHIAFTPDKYITRGDCFTNMKNENAEKTEKERPTKTDKKRKGITCYIALIV